MFSHVACFPFSIRHSHFASSASGWWMHLCLTFSKILLFSPNFLTLLQRRRRERESLSFWFRKTMNKSCYFHMLFSNFLKEGMVFISYLFIYLFIPCTFHCSHLWEWRGTGVRWGRTQAHVCSSACGRLRLVSPVFLHLLLHWVRIF